MLVALIDNEKRTFCSGNMAFITFDLSAAASSAFSGVGAGIVVVVVVVAVVVDVG